MKIFTKTDIGLERTENQDCVWGKMLSRNACAAILCDGMGGESEGGLASRMAVDIISKRILESFSEDMSADSIRDLLVTAAAEANNSVWDTSRMQVHQVMGTTCVAVIVLDGMAYILNVGDSRAYHLFADNDDDCIRQITKDHSRVQQLMERGQITEEQAKNHPERNRITRAIGAEANVLPDYYELPLNDGDMILMCSDGLSSYGDDMDILDICFDSRADECCGKLISYANGNGGKDNISVAFILNK